MSNLLKKSTFFFIISFILTTSNFLALQNLNIVQSDHLSFDSFNSSNRYFSISYLTYCCSYVIFSNVPVWVYIINNLINFFNIRISKLSSNFFVSLMLTIIIFHLINFFLVLILTFLNNLNFYLIFFMNMI